MLEPVCFFVWFGFFEGMQVKSIHTVRISCLRSENPYVQKRLSPSYGGGNDQHDR